MEHEHDTAVTEPQAGKPANGNRKKTAIVIAAAALVGAGAAVAASKIRHGSSAARAVAGTATTTTPRIGTAPFQGFPGGRGDFGGRAGGLDDGVRTGAAPP